MKKIDINQSFNTFLNLVLSKREKRNAALTKTCDVLYISFKELTLKDVLEMNPDNIFKLKGIGPVGYTEFCKIFVGSNVELAAYPFFQHYLMEQKKQLKQSNAEAPKIVVTPVKINTDPETTVFQIEVSGSAGSWMETANTSREANFFLRGLQAMNSFSGLPMLELPPIPQPE